MTGTHDAEDSHSVSGAPDRDNPFRARLHLRLDDPQKAKHASRAGALIVFFCALVTGIGALASLGAHAAWFARLAGVSLVLCALGYLVLRGSRIAAIMAWTAWVLGWVAFMQDPGFDYAWNLPPMILGLVALTWGVRGAFRQADFRRRGG